jgi:hypothetical protein
MKKLAVLFSILLFCFYSIASEPSSCWIASRESIYICKKISIHAHKARFVLQNGEKMSIPVVNVNSFSLNGSEFKKIPLYKHGKPTHKQVFMELVDNVNGMNLYRYGHSRNSFIKSKQTVYNYYLYDGDKLHLATDDIELSIAFVNGDKIPDYKTRLLNLKH